MIIEIVKKLCFFYLPFDLIQNKGILVLGEGGET